MLTPVNFGKVVTQNQQPTIEDPRMGMAKMMKTNQQSKPTRPNQPTQTAGRQYKPQPYKPTPSPWMPMPVAQPIAQPIQQVNGALPAFTEQQAMEEQRKNDLRKQAFVMDQQKARQQPVNPMQMQPRQDVPSVSLDDEMLKRYMLSKFQQRS